MRKENNLLLALDGTDDARTKDRNFFLMSIIHKIREGVLDSIVNGKGTATYEFLDAELNKLGREFPSIGKTLQAVYEACVSAGPSLYSRASSPPTSIPSMWKDLIFRLVIIESKLPNASERFITEYNVITGEHRHSFISDVVLSQQLRIWAQGSMLACHGEHITYFDAEFELKHPGVLRNSGNGGDYFTSLRNDVEMDEKHMPLDDNRYTSGKEASPTDTAIARLIVDKIRKVTAEQVDRHLLEWLKEALDEGRVRSEMVGLGEGKLVNLEGRWFFGNAI